MKGWKASRNDLAWMIYEWPQKGRIGVTRLAPRAVALTLSRVIVVIVIASRMEPGKGKESSIVCESSK